MYSPSRCLTERPRKVSFAFMRLHADKLSSFIIAICLIQPSNHHDVPVCPRPEQHCGTVEQFRRLAQAIPQCFSPIVVIYRNRGVRARQQEINQKQKIKGPIRSNSQAPSGAHRQYQGQLAATSGHMSARRQASGAMLEMSALRWPQLFARHLVALTSYSEYVVVIVFV